MFQQLLSPEIIGTKGWVEVWCNGCGDYAEVAIQVGDEPDYESCTANLCLRCFDEAVKLRNTVEAGGPA